MVLNNGSTSKEEPPLHWGSPFDGKPTASLNIQSSDSHFRDTPITRLNVDIKPKIVSTTTIGTNH